MFENSLINSEVSKLILELLRKGSTNKLVDRASVRCDVKKRSFANCGEIMLRLNEVRMTGEKTLKSKTSNKLR